MKMTTKQVADFFGKSVTTVLRAAKKAGVETRKGQAKLYTKEEVSSLSKALYKTVPAIVKDSIDLTFANDVSEPMANAKVSFLSEKDIAIISQIVSVTVSETIKALDGRMTNIEQKIEQRKLLLAAPRLDARAHIKKMIDEYVSRNGIEHRDAYRYLYREFFYRTRCNASLCAKNRGMKTIDYIDDEGMIEILEAIAMEVL